MSNHSTTWQRWAYSSLTCTSSKKPQTRTHWDNNLQNVFILSTICFLSKTILFIHFELSYSLYANLNMWAPNDITCFISYAIMLMTRTAFVIPISCSQQDKVKSQWLKLTRERNNNTSCMHVFYVSIYLHIFLSLCSWNWISPLIWTGKLKLANVNKVETTWEKMCFEQQWCCDLNAMKKES